MYMYFLTRQKVFAQSNNKTNYYYQHTQSCMRVHCLKPLDQVMYEIYDLLFIQCLFFFQVFTSVLCEPELALYVHKTSQVNHSPCYLSRYENIMRHNLVKLAQLNRCDYDVVAYHQMGLSLLVQLQDGDQDIAHSLISSSLFTSRECRQVLRYCTFCIQLPVSQITTC